MPLKAAKYIPPTVQADAYLNQANPVSGTKYEVLATTENVKILAIALEVVWTVQPTPLELHITIDGQTWYFGVANPVSDQAYGPIGFNPTLNLLGSGSGNLIADYTAAYLPIFPFDCKSIKIEAETTGGTVSALRCRVIYAKY